MSLVVHPPEKHAVHAHLCRAYPEEGCGAMLGRDRAGVREVVRVWPMDNRHPDARTRRYTIDPLQLLAADRAARESGLEVLGFFHSHPDHPPEPSTFDREQAWPWYTYWIVAVERGRVTGERAWRLRDDRSRFDDEPIETSDAAGDPA